MDESLQNLKCPKCNGPMISRANRKDGSRFWGCKDYPNCTGTRDSMGLSRDERTQANKEEPYEDEVTWKRRYD